MKTIDHNDKFTVLHNSELSKVDGGLVVTAGLIGGIGAFTIGWLIGSKIRN